MKTRNLRTRKTLPAGMATAATLALAITSASAGQTWDGGGADNNWNTPGNWDDDTLPTFGSAINFAGNTRNTANNDLAANTTIGGINFTNNGTADRTNGFTLTGNRITLGGNIVMTGSSVSSPIATTIELDMILNATRRATLGANHTLTISGVISQDATNRRSVAASSPSAETTPSAQTCSSVATQPSISQRSRIPARQAMSGAALR